MVEIIKELNIEVSKPNVFQAVVAKQYDMNTRFIKATFVDNGDKITIPQSDTLMVTINALRSDGESKGFDGTINEDGTVTVPLHSWMLELVGDVICDISVVDLAASANKKLTTTSFHLLVERAAWDGDGMTNDPQYNLLIKLLNTVESAGEIAEEALQKSNEANAVYDSMVAVTRASEAIIENNETIISAMNGRLDEAIAMRGSDGATSELIKKDNVSMRFTSDGIHATLILSMSSLPVSTGSFYHISLPKAYHPFAESVTVELGGAGLPSGVTACLDRGLDNGDDDNMELFIYNNDREDKVITGRGTATYPIKHKYIPELADIRVDTDGTVHSSAGTAVREQIASIKSTVEGMNDIVGDLNADNAANIRLINDMEKEIDAMADNFDVAEGEVIVGKNLLNVDATADKPQNGGFWRDMRFLDTGEIVCKSNGDIYGLKNDSSASGACITDFVPAKQGSYILGSSSYGDAGRVGMAFRRVFGYGEDKNLIGLLVSSTRYVTPAKLEGVAYVRMQVTTTYADAEGQIEYAGTNSTVGTEYEPYTETVVEGACTLKRGCMPVEFDALEKRVGDLEENDGPDSDDPADGVTEEQVAAIVDDYLQDEGLITKVVGKNLLDINTIERGIRFDDEGNTTTSSASTYCITPFIPFAPMDSLVFTYCSDAESGTRSRMTARRVIGYDEDKNLVGLISAVGSGVNSIGGQNGVYYVRLQLTTENVESQGQVEYGGYDQHTDYEPYALTTVPSGEESFGAMKPKRFEVACKGASDITIVGDTVLTFSPSDGTSSGNGYIYAYQINPVAGTGAICRYIAHDWGHLNTIDYCPENDCLIFGNGGGSYNTAGKFYIVPNAKSLVLDRVVTTALLADVAIEIDCTEYDFGSKLNMCWGSDNNGRNDLAYMITNDNKNIRLVQLGKGANALNKGVLIEGKTENEFNGTFAVLNEYTLTDGIPNGTSTNCNQGTQYYGGKLYAAIGHRPHCYWVITLDSQKGVATYEEIYEPYYNADGTAISGATEGMCVTDKYIIYTIATTSPSTVKLVFEERK